MSHQLHPTDEITAPPSEEYAANATSDPGSREEAAAPPFGQALVPEVILSEGSHPLPPEQIVAALDDDNDDGGTNAKRIVAGTSPASKSNDDDCGDVPIPHAQMAVGLEATEEGGDMTIMEKKKKHAGAAAAASGGNRTVLDDGPAAPAHSPSSGSVDVERRGSGSDAAAPPSGTWPSAPRREPSSVRVIEATLVEDKPAPPVYDAILVAGPSGSGDDANDPLRWKRHKFAIAFAVVAVLLFGALTATVAAMLASNNKGGENGDENSNSNADANTEESVGKSGSLSTTAAPSTNATSVITDSSNVPSALPSHATNHLSLRPAPYKSTSVPSRPTTLSPTTVAPTLLPVVPPTASPSTSVTFSIVRECNQILEVSAPREFDDIEVGIYQILLQRYTANFGDMVGTPFVVTNCTVTEQTWVGGRRVVQREGSSGHGLQGDDSARERRLGRNLGKFEGFGEDVRKTRQKEEKRSHLQSSKWLRHNPKTDLQAEILEHMVPSPPSSRTLQTTTPRILLVVQFNIHYESRYGVVIDDYPSLFQEYINSNLEEVTLDMQAVFLPVVLAREVIVYNTKQPTLAPSPGGSGRSILPTPVVPPPTPQGGSLLPFASLVPNVAQSTAPITSFAPVPTDQPTRIVSSTPSPSTNSTFEFGSTYIPTATSVRSCNYRYNWSCSHSEGKTTLFHTFIFSLDTSAGSYPAVANFYWDENSNDPGDFLMLSGTYGAGEEAVLEGSHVYDQEGGYNTRFALYFGMGAGGCGGNLYEQGGIFFAGTSCSYSDTLTDLTFVSY